MAISTNGTVIARLAGGLYNTVMSNATYLEVASQDPSTLANTLYARDFAMKTDMEVAQTLLANLGLASQAGLDQWVAGQLTAAGNGNKGAKIVSLLNAFAGMASDATWGTYATAFNTKVDAALAASQTTGSVEAKFADAGAVTAGAFTLTTGADALVGTAGNDTFSAPTQDGTTIQSGDSIDGGAGTGDALTLALTGTANNSLTGLTVKNVETISITGAANLGTGAANSAAALTAKNAAAIANSAASAKLALAIARDAAAAEVAGAADADAVTALKGISTADYEADYTDAATSGFTKAQLVAAATAALTSATGATLTDDDDVTDRADALADAAGALATDAAESAEDAEYDLADANAEYDALASVQGVATVAASQFVGATAITVDGTTTKVTGIANGQTITLAAAGAISSTVTGAGTLTYAAGTTAATIGLTSANGTITLDDASTTTDTTTLKTLTVNGSIYRNVAASTTTHVTADPGTITINDNLGLSSGETITTVNLGITSTAVVALADLSKLVTVDASTSTGALSITLTEANSAKLANVTGGAGADTLAVTLDTDENGLTGAKSVTVSGGAGNDRITVTDSGTGVVKVNGNDGNDNFVIGTADLGNTLVIDGGAGTDKITFTADADELSEGELVALEDLTSVERAQFVGVATLDASLVSQFTTIDLGTATEEITQVANDQTVNAAIDATITAKGYIALGSEEADELDTPLTSTQYAGALTVNASGEDTELAINASSLTLNVANISSTTALKVGDQTASDVYLTGNLKTLTINMTSGNDFVTGPTTNDVISSVDLTISDSKDADNNFDELGNLTSIILKGVGAASITTNAGGVTKLATIDASGLGGTQTALANNGDNEGLPLGGLTFHGNIDVTETVKLGAGQDTITVDNSSKSTKMDTITGFKLVANNDGTLNEDMSDILDVVVDEETSEWIAVTANESLSLNANLVAIAAKVGVTDDAKYDNVVFRYKGDTYVYAEGVSEGTTLDAGDTVIKLTGTLDLDLLTQNLIGNQTASGLIGGA
jgi:hypothetical protein